MKELSIEEKAKRYDDRLEKAKKWYDSNTNEGYRGIFEDIFPELKESKDEKIKKVIYGWIYTQPSQFFDSGFSKEEMLAWIEKQGEQKPVIEMKSAEESLGIDSNTYNKIVDECIYGEQKSDDVEEVNFFDDFRKTDSEVEPKFKVGDWIVHNDDGYICQIESIREDDYCLWPIDSDVEGYLKITDTDNEYHLWTIEDAKDGDVLKEDSCIFIVKKINSNGTAIVHCCLFNDGDFDLGFTLSFDVDSTYPATKEQRDLLFSKMKEAGYEWDAEKKELKKIEHNLDWSEEDERIYRSIIYSFIHNYPLTVQQQEFVKSFKDRVQPKQEWSEKDKYMLQKVIDFMKHPDLIKSTPTLSKSTIDWLEFLEERYTWKPSEEQMRVLDLAIKCGINRGTTEETMLVSLFNDLKKLI